MTRNEFVVHLTTQDCYPDEECDSDISQLWRNGINGEECYVPYVEELSTMTWCHIVYELKIDPPLESDAYYHVYVGWREKSYAEDLKKR